MMDDSDQDFSHLCSRLLKRVRRKDKVDSGDEKNNNPPKRRKRTKEDVKADRKPRFTSRTQPVAVSQGVSGSEKVADVVLRRMQQFKRASPERLLHAEDNQETTKGSEGNVPAPVTDVSGDEALALQLQLEMDREAQVAGDLEDGGLFFCQLCQKDLSSMSPSLRTQHINRCLDACEVSAPSTSHNSRDRPRIPECPVCGKNFKSEKSRSVHLKRCSADLGVKPNVLVEALRRQAVETERESTGDQSHQRGTSAARRNGVPLKKRGRKAQKLDEDTMVALALSRSLLEQEKEREEKEQEILAQLSSPPGGTAPVLKWKPGAGKGRGKRRKGLFPLQPPLLLIQDSQAALNRLQERVSSLLLCSRPPSPPTPTFSPSVLPFKPHGRLWDRSALHGGGPTSISEFYTAELSCFIQPMETPEVKPCEDAPILNPPAVTSSESGVFPENPVDKSFTPNQPYRPHTPCLGTQALQDLMELAEEGMTLTQYGYTTCTPAGEKSGKDYPGIEVPLSPSAPEKVEKTAKTTLVSKLASDLGSMVNNPQLSDVQLQVDSGEVFFTHSFMLYARCPLLANTVHDSGFGVQEEGLPVARRVLMGDVLGEAVLALLEYIYTAHCPLTHALLPHIQQLADRYALAELQQQCEEYSGRTGMFSGPEPSEQEDQKLAESNFLELLQSMWMHEDSEEEEGFKEAAVEKGDMERERDEEQVDEEELDEIYEFAATQRKIETETEKKEDEGDGNTSPGNEIEDDGVEKSEFLLEKPVSCYSKKHVDGSEAAIVSSPTESQKDWVGLVPDVVSGTNGHIEPDATLDRSYDHLFSQSVGDYIEPSQTPAACSQQKNPKSSPVNTFRNLCISDVIDLSVSPPLSSGDQSFPMPGVSPVFRKGEDIPLKEDFSKSQSIDHPPESHSKQVELIVLSDDSDEESGVDGNHNPATIQSPTTESSFKSPLALPILSTSHEVKNRLKESGPTGHASEGVNVSKHRLTIIEGKSDPSEQCSPGSGNDSVFDGSAEVSWLIPATPVATTRCSSTQTCIGMRRLQLFPKSCSPKSSSSSSSDKSKPVTFGFSGSGFPRELVSLSQLNKSYQSPSKEHPCTDPDRSSVYQRPLHHLRLSQLTSDGSHIGINTVHSSQDVPGPSSSTPLPSVHGFHRKIHFDSSINADADCGVQPSDSRRDFKSFDGKNGSQLYLQLSPNQSKLLEKKQGSSFHGGSSRQSTNSQICLEGSRNSDEVVNQSMRVAEGILLPVMADTVDVEGNEKEKEERNPNQSDHVGNSFYDLDEPPIAFNDSWGLDGGIVSQRPCFSLRLESSDETLSPKVPQDKGQTCLQTPSGTQEQIPATSPASVNHSLPDPAMWGDWEEEEDVVLPLSQRLVAPSVKRVAELKTPVACKTKNKGPLVPITPMPGFSDMDTPELKNRLNRFGVRPLPKKQMVLKLKEIHQYTHQLQSSDSEDDQTSAPKQFLKSQPTLPSFKQPAVPPAVSPLKLPPSEPDEPLSASQNSSTSSTAESERSNPEQCCSEDDESDSEGTTASQAVVKEKDKLQAVRQFILSDPELYRMVLQYKPLSLAELRARLRAAGIRLGAAKLLDFLDSQCITFSTAKPGQTSRRKRRAKTTTNTCVAGRGKKKSYNVIK